MTEYSELLSLIRRSWRHAVYAWKGGISAWLTAPFGLEFSRVSGRATLLEYPRKSGRYLPITESFPQVVLYGAAPRRHEAVGSDIIGHFAIRHVDINRQEIID